MKVSNSKYENANLAFFDPYGKAHQVKIKDWVLDIDPEHLSLLAKELGPLSAHVPEPVVEEPLAEVLELVKELKVEPEAKAEPKEMPKKPGKKG